MAVDINGERGDFFRSFKGLRQGDPLSPLLFNLVADALSSMLSAAASAGDIEGLVPPSSRGRAYTPTVCGRYDNIFEELGSEYCKSKNYPVML